MFSLSRGGGTKEGKKILHPLSVQDINACLSALILGENSARKQHGGNARPKSSVLVWILDSSENCEEILAAISLHLLAFLCASAQTTYNDVIHLSKEDQTHIHHLT